jgi:homoserine dehydrogenase
MPCPALPCPTLSNPCDQFSSRFSPPCRRPPAPQLAIDKRMMESDPRIDLGGLDVAQKVITLARVVGYELELSAVDLVPLVPVAVTGPPLPLHRPPSADDARALAEALAGYDDSFEAGPLGSQLDAQHRLRFLATLQFEGGRARATVRPELIRIGDWNTQHVRDNEVSATIFSTLTPGGTRLSSAGQGGMSGASGLLADILRCCRTLRGGSLHRGT